MVMREFLYQNAGITVDDSPVARGIQTADLEARQINNQYVIQKQENLEVRNIWHNSSMSIFKSYFFCFAGIH